MNNKGSVRELFVENKSISQGLAPRYGKKELVLRDSLPIILLGAVIGVYGWSVVRELVDVSHRLNQLTISDQPEPAEPATVVPMDPPPLALDAIDTAASGWFEGSRKYREITIRSIQILPEPQPPSTPPVPEPPAVVEPIPIATAPLIPAFRLTGVFLGEQIQEALVELNGEKRKLVPGEEIDGWRLVELRSKNIVFESMTGQRETVYLFQAVR